MGRERIFLNSQPLLYCTTTVSVPCSVFVCFGFNIIPSLGEVHETIILLSVKKYDYRHWPIMVEKHRKNTNERKIVGHFKFVIVFRVFGVAEIDVKVRKSFIKHTVEGCRFLPVHYLHRCNHPTLTISHTHTVITT